MADSDSREVLCRYFMQGVCRNGSNCRFSHNLQKSPSMVCKFFLQGNCSFGDACRYDHVRPKHAPKAPPPRSCPPVTVPRPAPADEAGVQRLGRILAASSISEDASSSQPAAAWSNAFLPDNMEDLGIRAVDDGNAPRPSAVTDPAELPICSQYAAFGVCSKGDSCPKIHGNLCHICNKHILHPYRPEEAEEHVRQCALRKERADALVKSAEVECAICLEKVLSKSAASERKFGLMACEHAFCLGCIRSWRCQYVGVDVDTALRTCPICRTTTHFITPSSVWPSSQEEKDSIVNGYKGKLASIDCRNFDRGRGTCPFGTSCFYRHMLPDGSLDEPELRHYGNADGDVGVVRPVLLAHFMEMPGSRSAQTLGRR